VTIVLKQHGGHKQDSACLAPPIACDVELATTMMVRRTLVGLHDVSRAAVMLDMETMAVGFVLAVRSTSVKHATMPRAMSPRVCAICAKLVMDLLRMGRAVHAHMRNVYVPLPATVMLALLGGAFFQMVLV